MFKYKIFGLRVLSEVPLKCYEDEFTNADVNIIFDHSIDGYEAEYHFVETKGKVSYLNMPMGGIYKVSNGSEIKISPSESAEDRVIKHYLLAQCFATLLIQRKMFPLHGAVLQKDNISIAIVGHSGAGKTSLSTGLILNGWKMITDDIIGINFDDGNVYPEPSYPYKKIWKTTAEVFGLEVKQENSIFDRIDKYYYDNPDFFTQTRAPLKYVFEIKKGDVDEVDCSHMENGKLLPVLITNSYRYHIVKDSNQLVDHMQFMANICKKVSGYVVQRPLDGFTVNGQIKLIESIVRKDYE